MMAPGNYRPDGSPIIGISPSIAPKAVDPNAIDNRLRGLRGILETPEMLAGGGTKAGGGTIPVPGYNPRDMQNQISVANIDDQGNITGQTGVSRVVAQYGNIKDLDSFSPELQAAIQGYQSRPEGGGILGKLGPDPSAIFANQAKIPYNATASPDPYENYNVADAYKQSDFYDDSMQSQGYLDFLQNSKDNFMRRDMQMDGKSLAYNDARSKIFDAYDTFNPVTNIAEQEAYYSENPYKLNGPGNVRKYDDGFFLNTGKPTITNGGFDMKMPDSFVKPDFVTADYDHLKNIGEPSTLPALPDFGEPITEMPTPATGGMNSDFANQLLSGIGNLFDKYLSSPSMKQNNLGMDSTNQITPPTPPEQMMTADTQSSMPNSLGSLGSQGMFTPGRGY
jgi:hypothetical protein